MKHVMAWGMMALLGWAAQGCGNGECEDGGRTYEDGSEWTCLDGCNDCSCQGGEITTTAAACAGPPGPAAGKYKCKEGGFFHTHGELWTCEDGCSACTCDDGKLSKDSSPCG